MSNIVPLPRTRDLTPAQIRLARNTVAKDCNEAEFDLFMAQAQRAGLDPFRKQISAIVFNKNKPDKRTMAVVTTIDGYRALAERAGDYRPPSTAAEFEQDDALKSDLNPEGLIVARVTCYRRYGEEWVPVMGEAYWEEFAPLKDEWENGQKTGRQKLDGSWPRMPRLMLAKCAEAQALRRGWPDSMGGMYVQEEMQRAVIIDATASEVVAEEEARLRLKRIGAGSPSITFDLTDGLTSISVGMVFDRLEAHLRGLNDPGDVEHFLKRNAEPLRQFWAHDKSAALAFKDQCERRMEALTKADAFPGDA